MGQAAQNDAADIKLRAERRAGELLTVGPKHPGSRNTGKRAGDDIVSPPKLKDIGITAKQSERWQLQAGVPAPDFEKFVVETKAGGEELTSRGLRRLALKRRAELELRAIAARETRMPDGLYDVIVTAPPWPMEKGLPRPVCTQMGKRPRGISRCVTWWPHRRDAGRCPPPPTAASTTPG